MSRAMFSDNASGAAKALSGRELPARANYWRSRQSREAKRPIVVWEPIPRWMRRNVPTARKRVVDFGSGITSPFSRRFLEENGSFTNYRAYDIDVDVVSHLRAAGTYYDFFADDTLLESFDLVYSDNNYEHLTVAERDDFVSRAYDLLRPGGRLVIAYPHIANLNIIEHFRGDRTHTLVSREHEASYLDSVGFTTRLYLAGLYFPYMPIVFSVRQFLRNVLLGYWPQTMVILVGEK